MLLYSLRFVDVDIVESLLPPLSWPKTPERPSEQEASFISAVNTLTAFGIDYFIARELVAGWFQAAMYTDGLTFAGAMRDAEMQANLLVTRMSRLSQNPTFLGIPWQILAVGLVVGVMVYLVGPSRRRSDKWDFPSTAYLMRYQEQMYFAELAVCYRGERGVYERSFNFWKPVMYHAKNLRWKEGFEDQFVFAGINWVGYWKFPFFVSFRVRVVYATFIGLVHRTGQQLSHHQQSKTTLPFQTQNCKGKTKSNVPYFPFTIGANFSKCRHILEC